jgi:hypothetical protein
VTKKHRDKIYIGIFALAAGVLAWGVWFNYRPQVIYAGCLDITDKTSYFQTKYNLETEKAPSEEVFHNCLHDAGYYGN